MWMIPLHLQVNQNTWYDDDSLISIYYVISLTDATSHGKCTVEPVLSDHSKIDKTKIIMTNGSLI